MQKNKLPTTPLINDAIELNNINIMTYKTIKTSLINKKNEIKLYDSIEKTADNFNQALDKESCQKKRQQSLTIKIPNLILKGSLQDSSKKSLFFIIKIKNFKKNYEKC